MPSIDEKAEEAARNSEQDLRISPAIEASQMQPRRNTRRRRVAAALVACCLTAVALIGWAVQSTVVGCAESGPALSSSSSTEADGADGASSSSESAPPATNAPADASQGGEPAGTGDGQSSLAASSTQESAASAASSADAGTGDSASSAPAASDPAPAPSAPASSISVSVSVSSTSVGNPVSGTATVVLARGATVYDALQASGFDVTARSSQYGMYVSAIGGLAEKQHGGASGWLYAVNGSTPAASCSGFELSDGDAVSWFYTV